MGCDVTVRLASLDELDELVAWRMEVLRCVFELQEDADVSALREENLRYYREELPRGGHVAAFAELGGERVGCAALCLQREMPSPDNPDGRCAYLMNVYVRPAHRGRGVARVAALHLYPALSGRHGGDGLSDALRKLCRLATGRGAAIGYGGAGGPAALYQCD